MELKDGNIYKCKDGLVRRLDKITDTHLSYSIQIDKNFYMSVSPTLKAYVLNEFLEGEVIA